MSDDKRDDDVSHVPGSFALLRRQIRNGIITSDVLKVLRSVATNHELSQFLNMKVVTAVAYLKKDQVGTLDEWIAAVVNDTGTMENKDYRHGSSKDTRTRAFVVLPLEDLIGKLVAERNRLKKVKTPEAESKQKMLKLMVNTVYGVIASPYFSIGNTVIANQITARARVGAWMMNKALHTRQSITDGGIYSLLEVPIFKPNAKLPGLSVLSDNMQWEKDKHCTRKLQPLGGIDWLEVFDKKGPELLQLDKIASDHIALFWDRYQLELPFEVEHKLENTFSTAVYMSKAHYLLVTFDGNKKYKIRSAREHKDPSLRKHPTFELMKNLAEGSNIFPKEMKYDYTSILKIGKWVRAKVSVDGFVAIKQLNLRPGDNVSEERTARYNNTHIFCETVEQFEKRSKRKTVNHKLPVEWFERYREQGFKKVHSQMLLDSLLPGKNEGKNLGNQNAVKQIDSIVTNL